MERDVEITLVPFLDFIVGQEALPRFDGLQHQWRFRFTAKPDVMDFLWNHVVILN